MASTGVEPQVSSSAAASQRRGCAVQGLGTAVPENAIPSAVTAERLGLKEEWIVQRLGVHRRRTLAEGERLSDLAGLAGSRAIADAGLEPDAIDLVITASTTQDELIPNMAPLAAAAAGVPGVGAFDVGAACTGFLAGLAVGAAQVETGRADNVLLIGADAGARHTDPDDRTTAPLFADGAGAVVLAADAEARVGPGRLWSDAEGAELVYMPRDRQVIVMDGLETYRHAVTALTAATRWLLENQGLETSDIDLFVYHQANSRIVRGISDRLGIEDRQRADYIADTGNTSAASIPLALSGLVADGRLHPGSRLLLGAIGAGFIWGTTLLEWGRSSDDAKKLR